MRLKSNEGENMEKTTKDNKNGERSVVIEGQTGLYEEKPKVEKQPTKDRYWLILSRYTYNNRIKKHTMIADTMKQAVQDFLRYKDDGEEFLMINEIEFGALSVIASTL